MAARSSLRLTVLITLTLVSILALPVYSQTDRGIIEVLVLDENEGVIPGVTVTVTRPETGFQAVEVTEATGLARFLALQPGTYSVIADLSGFGSVSQEDMVLRTGQTQKITLILRPRAAETITVEASSDVVDVYRSDTSSNIIPEQIESLPVADRDFQKLAFIAPGVQRERGGFRFIGGGPVVGASGNASQATILVDGLDYTDPALGLSRTKFSQDAIREFRVIQNRFDPEIGGSSGGALSIVTKSGTNNLSGTVFGFARDEALREPGDLEQDEKDYSRYQLGFTVGGPITRDRTHFFGAFEYVDEDNISLFRPGGAFADLAADVEHPFTQYLGFVSLDHQISTDQSLAGKFVYEDYSEENFRVGGIADVSYGQSLERENWNVSANHTWILSNGKLNELRVQAGNHWYFEPTNSDEVGEWFSSGTTLQTGSNLLGDLLGEGDFYEIRDTYHMSLADGRHNLKMGAAYQYIDERSDIPVYQNGLFLWVFDNRSLPLAYAYGTGSSDISTSSATSATRSASPTAAACSIATSNRPTSSVDRT
ncbi:MAG: carboxypeptidase regulatory-like domain-containing protein, partial [Thermoanaerobaculia bacterium]|nr:carboxypeptidase regulatory-like domain-containing protein [Thermoanaerobaculia bacterium]